MLGTIFTFITFSSFSQSDYKYPFVIPKNTEINGTITLIGEARGSFQFKVDPSVVSNLIVKLPTTNGSSGHVLTTDGAGNLSWQAAGSGSMIYPSGSGIPIVVGGTLWGTSIPDSSANWNTAYTDRLKWDGGATELSAATGRTSLGGTTVGQNIFTLTNPGAITFLRLNADNTVTTRSATNFKTDISLENVTNESKATMFTSPVFTGTTPRLGSPVTDTLATQAYARSYGGTGTVVIGDVRDEIADSLNVLRPLYVEVADTTDMLSNYLLDSETAAAVTGFTPAGGSLMLAGADDVTITTTAATNVTLPTSGTLATSSDLSAYSLTSHEHELSELLSNVVDSTAIINGKLAFFIGADTASLHINVTDIIDLSDYAVMKEDTLAGGNYYTQRQVDSISAAIRSESFALNDTVLYFAPVIGMGQANDTTLFSTTDILYFFRWGGSYDLVLTSVTGVVYGTTPDIDIAILKDVNFRDATPTEVLSADLTITSTTTGNTATSFSSATIEPGEWVWIRVDQCTAQPTQCAIELYGYLSE